MRVRLDYGTDGLEVELPDGRVTIIEPMPRPAVPDAHATLMEAIRALCDHVVVMSAGAQIAAGSPDAVLRDPEVARVYLGEGDG